MATSAPSSKTYTISLPPELAAKAEALAAQDGLTVNDLLLESFRAYFVDGMGRPLEQIAAYAASHNPHGYTEADIPRLIVEERKEMATVHSGFLPGGAND